LGAPVRIQVTLTNISAMPVDSPSSLSLSAGFVRGRVIDSAGTVRTFSPLVLSETDVATQDLAAGKSLEEWLTLFQGAQGPLFPAPGNYRVVLEVTWRGKTEETRNKIDFIVLGETRVRVSRAVDESHAAAAEKVLNTSDVLSTIVFGGDHLKQGIEAIGIALKNAVLRPHFAYIEAKRLATRFGKRQPDLGAAADLIDQATVMSPAEFRKAVRLVEADANSPGAAAMASRLKSEMNRRDLSDDNELPRSKLRGIRKA
jgi:hypothetical protein